MAKYSIEDTTLIALGDAIRGKTSETRQVILADELWEIELDVLAAKFYPFPEGTRKVVIKKVQGGSKFNHYHRQANGTDNSIFLNDEYVIENVTSTREGFMVGNYGGSSTLTASYQITCYADDEKNTLTPMQMAEAIEGLPPSPPEEAFTITDNGYFRFANRGWDWFINLYGDKIKTSKLTDMTSMFKNSYVKKIPFDINGDTSKSYIPMTNMFDGCQFLREVPKIIGKPDASNDFFASCYYLREVTEEAVAGLDWSYVDSRTSTYSCSRGSTFEDCHSLRKFPMSFLAHGNPVGAYSSSIYYYGFDSCYVLDELVGLPIPHKNAKWTSNTFVSTFSYCSRLKRLTFETNDDGSPIKIDGWSKQSIDLSKNVGFYNISSAAIFTSYNSGLTEDTWIKDDATYAALKNNEDSFTTNVNYSRYNKTSAVETINSLPDLSGGAGGNTIKFTGAAGSLTDGGAINTMTQEEIAVATAKGWTVTFA